MSRSKLFKEELELDELRETEFQLRQREQEFEENRRRITQERSDRERMMPPLDDIQARNKRKLHELHVSRGQVANVRRDQTGSFLLLVLLVIATSALVWWGIKIMQQGG